MGQAAARTSLDDVGKPTMGQSTASAEMQRQRMSVGRATAGIDVSDRYSHLCVLGEDGEVVREQRVRTTEEELTRALVPVPGAQLEARQLRWPRPGDPSVRVQSPRRGAQPARQPPPQERNVPRGLRLASRSRLESLLRPGAGRGEEAQRRPHLPRPQALRRDPDHAPPATAVPVQAYPPPRRGRLMASPDLESRPHGP